MRKLSVAFVVILVLLSGCGKSLDRNWNYTPASDPVKTVESAIQGEERKDYCSSVAVMAVTANQEETSRVIEMYENYQNGWTKNYLEEHMRAIYASYHVEYDGTKTFQPSGDIERFFLLLLNDTTGKWEIWSSTTNDAPLSEGVPTG